MYKVMIIDDEKLICQGVSSKINRINHSLIDDVIESTDPLEALKIISDINPDIIITDMEMPNISGLELISQLSQMTTQPKIIILSGHDDYRYVRSSFQLGVVDYILKPVTIDELKDKLEQAIELINEEKNSFNPLDNKISKALNNLTFSKDIKNKNESYEYLSSVLSNEIYQLSSISLPNNYQLSDLNQLTKRFVDSLDKNIKVINYYDKFKNCILLFNYNKIETASYLIEIYQHFLTELSKENNYKAKIALTSPIYNLMEYKKIFQQLQDILATKIQYKPYKLITLDKSHIDNNVNDSKEISKIIKWFSENDFISIINYIDYYFILKPINNDFHIFPKRIYILLMQKINELVYSNDLHQKDLFTRTFESFDSYAEIRMYLKSCIHKIQQFIDEKDTTSVSAIEYAKAYIDAHLDESLSMAQVSNYLSLNYSYFSKLFKEKIGISFRKYLTIKRMEKAKVLLRNPTNKVYEIAKQTGYDNAQNFSRAFKSHFGYSPADYRKKR